MLVRICVCVFRRKCSDPSALRRVRLASGDATRPGTIHDAVDLDLTYTPHSWRCARARLPVGRVAPRRWAVTFPRATKAIGAALREDQLPILGGAAASDQERRSGTTVTWRSPPPSSGEGTPFAAGRAGPTLAPERATVDAR
jgi:hypothetical protein